MKEDFIGSVLRVLVVILCVLVIGLGASFVFLGNSMDVASRAVIPKDLVDVSFNYDNENRFLINNGLIKNIRREDLAITNFDVIISEVGDGVEYNFDIVNKGNVLAEISYLYLGKPTCIDENNMSAIKVCDNLDYNIVYDNGVKVKKGDLLDVGEVKRLKLYVKLNDVDLELDNKINVNDLNVKIGVSKVEEK